MQNDKGNSMVLIDVDNKDVEIHRGKRTVEEIKQLAKVPLDYDLDQIINGEIVSLSDDGSVVIHGDEVFVSHVKYNASSK